MNITLGNGKEIMRMAEIAKIDRGTPYITHEESEMDRYLNWFPDIEGQK